MDAVKIDLNAFIEKFYGEVCAAELEPVLKTLKVLKEEGAFFRCGYCGYDIAGIWR